MSLVSCSIDEDAMSRGQVFFGRIFLHRCAFQFREIGGIWSLSLTHSNVSSQDSTRTPVSLKREYFSQNGSWKTVYLEKKR